MLAVHGWGGYYKFNVKDLFNSNTSFKKFKKSNWYKYKGKDSKVKSKLKSIGWDGPDYGDKDFPKDLIGSIYGHGSSEYNKEITNFKRIELPGANLKKGLSNLLVVI